MKSISGHSRPVIPQVAAIALMLGTSCFAASAGKSLVSISHFGTLASSLRLTGRKPNTQGSVFVAEYHRIQQGRGDMFRSPADFAKDLENYYAAGFRPVLASEYLSNRMRLPSGTSPIVITFDDSIASQIQMRDDGSVTPDCAVGIWQAFARSHPDFPVHATFFVLPDVMWGQKKLVNQKIQWLFHAGSELANHTTTHPKLSHLSDEKVKWELGNASEKLEAYGQKGPHSMALPYGINPKNKSILNGFDWKGQHISFTGVFLVGANPAPSPISTKFNRLRVPRILAISGPYGINFWLDQLKKGHVKPFIQP